MRTVLALSLILAAAACGPPSPELGEHCDDDNHCADGLGCDPIGPFDDPGVCTMSCRNPGSGTGRPKNVPPECGDDAVCVATPVGLDSCLALCVDGGCAYGAPGYPFLDDPGLCVCIPWK